MGQFLGPHKSIIFTIIGVAIVAALPLILPSYWTQMLAQVIIMALFATALNMEMGYAGMMPLGQSMFLGLGAYSFGIFILKVGMPFFLAIAMALVFCVVVNAIIGFLCLRGKPLTFGLLHLAFNILFVTLVAKLIPVTGGDAGLTGVPRPELFSDNFYFYLLVLGVVLVCYLIIRIIMNSPFGKVAQGLRENEERLIFLGIDTKRYQLILFIISGFFAGVAGILLAMLNRGVFPAYIQLILSAQAMMMCLIGGAFTFWGPSLGSALVIIFSNTVSNYVTYWQGILGLLMVATVLGFRGGILRKGKSKAGYASLVNKVKYTGREEKTSAAGTPEK
jgi:branched-chain amino acid transport system permease protein